MSIVPLLSGPDSHPASGEDGELRVLLFAGELGRTIPLDVLWKYDPGDG